MNKRLTEDFNLSEFTNSQYAVRHNINNQPNDYELANIINITAPTMQKIRDLLGAPVHITSGYRCYALNRAIGGSGTSAHMSGLAVDFVAPRAGTPKEVAEELKRHVKDLRIDQLINEGQWVHVGFAAPNKQPRNEVMTARFIKGKPTYEKGIV